MKRVAVWRESLCREKTVRTSCVNFHSIADLVSPSKPGETDRHADRPAEHRSPGAESTKSQPDDDIIDVVHHATERSPSVTTDVSSPLHIETISRPISRDTCISRSSCTSPALSPVSTLTPSVQSKPSPVKTLPQVSDTSRDLERDKSSPDADPSRGRKGRTIYKAQQVYVLEQVFSRTHYPDAEVIETLSKDLSITENKIKVWFQNKRARWRRRAAEAGHPAATLGLAPGQPGLPSWSTLNPAISQPVMLPQPIYPGLPGPPLSALGHVIPHSTAAFISPYQPFYSMDPSIPTLKHPIPGYPLPVSMLSLWPRDPTKLNAT